METPAPDFVAARALVVQPRLQKKQPRLRRRRGSEKRISKPEQLRSVCVHVVNKSQKVFFQDEKFSYCRDCTFSALGNAAGREILQCVTRGFFGRAAERRLFGGQGALSQILFP